MDLKLANRLNKVEPSPTLAITALANQLKAEGKDVIGLAAGEPDFDTPQHIKDAAIDALQKGQTKYTAVAGIASFREAVTMKLKNDNGLDYTPAQVVIGTGGKQILYNIFMAILSPGDEVIIPGPYWVSYKDMVSLAEGEPVIIPGDFDSMFKLTPDKLERAINKKTRAVIINSPSNPTGVAYTKEELQAFAAILEKHPDVWIISDDIYEKIFYDNAKFYNLAMLSPALAERTIIANGVSKAYSMTGWRLGYAAAKQTSVIKAIVTLQGQSTSNATTFAQYGGESALRGDQSCIEEMVAAFVKRRDFITDALNQMPGIRAHKPQGAFYVFPDFTPLVDSGALEKFKSAYPSAGESHSKLLVEALLDKEQVAVVPGVAFGYDNGFRISYATSMEQLEKCVERMNRFFKGLT